VKYLSLEGLVSAVREGAYVTTDRASHHVITVGSDSMEDTRSLGAVCGGRLFTQRDSESCNDGYCVACLSGNYPTELDW